MEPETTRTFSETLLEALRTKGISTEKLSQLTGISERYLTLLVSEEYQKLPAAPYVRGYVMKIAEALSLDGAALWQEYIAGAAGLRRPGKRDMLPENRFVTPQFNKRVVVVGALIVLAVVYAIVRLPVILGAPQLTLRDFPDTRTITTSTLVISGTMNPADELTINDERVYPESTGGFSRTVTLEPGFNTFTFRASRFLGRTTELVRQVFYQVPTSTREEVF
jgi:cytoskeletal protein RodZ